jgi:uncharacterized protein with gpF-like domain
VSNNLNSDEKRSEESFDDIINEIAAFQWSAILDNNVCPECEKLNGQCFEVGDPGLEAIKPPLHIDCRCMIAATLKEEVQQKPIEFTYLSEAEIYRLTNLKGRVR